MLSFRQWMKEQAGDATMMWSNKPGYDQNLQEPESLAYRKPTLPKTKSKKGEKVAKLFGKKIDEAYYRIGRQGNRYWGKVGAGIFFTQGDNVLLLKRSEKGDHPETWGLPGGKAEEGETAIGTAMRETKEECGQVKGKRIAFLESQDGHHHWTTFFFNVNEPFTCKLSDEHSDWAWVPFEELDQYNLHPKLKENIDRYVRKVRG